MILSQQINMHNKDIAIVSKTRNISVDYLKSLAIIFVIISHSDYGSKNIVSPLFCYVINSAVPIFLFISGYLYSKSYLNTDNKKSNVINWAICKFIRFIIPYTIAFVVEIFISLKFTRNKYVGDGNIIITYLLGGIGPGSYYFPLMIQYVMLFPFLYNFTKKNKSNSLIYGLFANITYEIIKNYLCLSEDIYRLLIFRYLFIIIFGIYIGQNNKINKYTNYMMMAIGFLYISMVKSKTISPIVFTQWNSTCMISSMLWLPIASFIVNYNELKDNRVIVNVSKSSFNIFLIQMIYYFLDIPKFFFKEKLIIELIIDIFVCIITGIIFNKIESKITNYIIIKIKQ